MNNFSHGPYISAYPLRLMMDYFASPEELHQQGMNYHYGQGVARNYERAALLFRRAAAQGYARSQNFLGYCYDKGLGVPQDQTEASKWYRRAADQGDVLGIYNLGVCYYDGNRGVPQNDEIAASLFLRAAREGDEDSAFMYGQCCEYGRGVATDLRAAAEWYRLAAKKGHERAAAALERLKQR